VKSKSGGLQGTSHSSVNQQKKNSRVSDKNGDKASKPDAPPDGMMSDHEQSLILADQ